MSNFLANALQRVVKGEATGLEILKRSDTDESLSSLEEEAAYPVRVVASRRREEEKEEKDPLVLPAGFPRVIYGRWRIERLLGNGSFGHVYEAVYKDQRVAIKMEEPGSKLLPYEAKIYDLLNRPPSRAELMAGHLSIPRKEWFGVVGGRNCLALQLLGESVETMMESRRLGVKDTLMIGMQMLAALEFVHSRHLIHRDVKSDNIVIGLFPKSNKIYLLDFGLSKQYRNPQTLVHHGYRENKSLTGTPRFASINNHLGIEQSRRDDMESLAYVLIYMIKGHLPWQGIKVPSKHKDSKRFKNYKILKMKQELPVDILCAGVPPCVKDLLLHARALKYSEKPSYTEFIDLFGRTLGELGLRVDWKFSWMDDARSQ